MPMIALPSRSFTDAISPTSTPAMLTVWPWPGVTACAVDISASISKKSWPISGTQAGSAQPLLAEDHGRHRGGHDQQAEDGQEVRQVLADRRLHFGLLRQRAALGAERVELAAHGLELGLLAQLVALGRALLARPASPPAGADFAAAGPLTFGSFCCVAGLARACTAAACPDTPGGCRAGPRCCCRTARRGWRSTGRATPTASRRRSGSARTCRCRRSSGPRRRCPRARRRTPCSSPRRS